MFASTVVTLQATTTVSMVLTRMVSRVALNSVQVSFTGTPFEGVPLQNVKAYLTNVQAQKNLLTGVGTNLKVLNSKKYVPEDMIGITMQGMLYDEKRANFFKENNIVVFRITNESVNNRFEETCNQLESYIQNRLSQME